MNVIVFSIFLFFSLLSLGYSFYNKKVIYFAFITSLFIIAVLGGSILSEGLTETYAGSYGFAYNNTSALTGMVSTTVTILANTNIFAQAIGSFLIVLGLITLFLAFWYMLKGSEEEEE